MRKIFLSLLLCCLAAAGGYAQDITVTDIHLDYEGQLGYKVLETYNTLNDVRALRISGPINSEDWKTIKEMRFLQELYMDDAVLLNEAVPESQFYDKSNLRNITLPVSCKTIGRSAFQHCYSLENIKCPNVERIEAYTFWSCNNLASIDLPEATYIEMNAFGYCSRLETANIPNVTYMEMDAFWYCQNLKTVNLPNATYIGDRCFKDCSALTEISLPASLTHIPDEAFNNCNKIRKIVCNAPIPPTTGIFPFSNEVIYAATINVQGASVPSFQADSFWGRFNNWEESPTTVTDLTLYNNMILLENTRIDKSSLTVCPGTSFSIYGERPQYFRSVSIMADDRGCGVFLSNCDAVESDTTTIAYNMVSNKWYYVTLPFDIGIADIGMTNFVLLAIYDYNGEKRAAEGIGGSWRRLREGTLKAGQGYIMLTSSDTQLIFKAGDNCRNNIFEQQTATLPLCEYPSELGTPEAGWNFVGNPFVTYFDISSIEFPSPITVWTGSTYLAYSPTDDELALQPLQPFFVQCPTGTDHITFNTAGRQTTADTAHSRTMTACRNEGAARRLANIVLKAADGSEHDRTRLVVNAAATDGYDMGRDAAKMMSTDETVAQIWTHRDGTRYAINEGPQTGRRVAMGMYLPAAGTYTIEAPRADMSLKLYDSLTGTETPLGTDGAAYTFVTAEAGTMADRFFLLTDSGTTGISTGTNRDDNAAAATFHTLDGRYAGNSADALAPGIYVKKEKTGKATKVIVRQ